MKRRRLALAALVVLLAVTGCSDGDDEAAQPGPSPGTAAPTGSLAPTTGTPGPQTSVSPTLPASCDDLLPTRAVVEAVGRLSGQTTYLAAAPVPQSGRLGRVTCGYGVQPAGDTTTPPLVQVSLIAYADAATATSRVDGTVEQSAAEGDTVTVTRVEQRPAYVLTAPDEVTLVLADGPRTLVIEIAPDLLPPESVVPVLTTLATGVLGGAASPTAT